MKLADIRNLEIKRRPLNISDTSEGYRARYSLDFEGYGHTSQTAVTTGSNCDTKLLENTDIEIRRLTITNTSTTETIKIGSKVANIPLGPGASIILSHYSPVENSLVYNDLGIVGIVIACIG